MTFANELGAIDNHMLALMRDLKHSVAHDMICGCNS